jgi:sigma-B regulation protein RsbU (phosphoserine phosphatase)
MPIEHQGKLSGILYLENALSAGVFTPSRIEVLRLLSSQIAVSMENARLHEQEKELTRMQEEFRLAARIQQELLPARPPVIPGYDLCGMNIPAQAVGGDYFDFIRIDDRHVAVCLGDVSGKGLPASLLMANLQASLRGQSRLTLSASDCIRGSNRLLHDSTGAEKFATVFYGILDTESHRFRYCNGGHETPFRVTSSGACTELTAGGLALGIMESFPYEEEEVDLAPGDLLVMYSDGVTEAMNPVYEQFGRDNLLGMIREHRHLSADALVERIVGMVRHHAGTAPQSDDITLVVVRRVDPAGA